MSDRLYTCLACEDRPCFQNKVSAYGHARANHRGLLDVCHVDELFQIIEAGPDSREAKAGPFFCAECGAGPFFQDYAARGHARVDHDAGSDPEYGVHYVSESERIRRQTARARDLRSEAERIGDHEAPRFASLVGVADFLTECGDRLPPEEAA